MKIAIENIYFFAVSVFEGEYGACASGVRDPSSLEVISNPTQSEESEQSCQHFAEEIQVKPSCSEHTSGAACGLQQSFTAPVLRKITFRHESVLN